MNKSRLSVIIAALMAVLSCGSPSVEKHIPELLSFMPSDAIAVASYDRVCDVLTLVDSSSVLKNINFGKLRNSKAALSFCYTTSLVPVLAVDTGKANSDTTEAVAAILAQADTLGLRADYIHDESQSGRRGALVISTSATELNSVQRHYDENASILDAPSFTEALEKCITAKDWMIFRNSGADKYIPRSFLMNYVQRREFIAFMQKCADWTTLAHVDKGKYVMDVVCGDFDTYYAKVIAAQPSGQSKLGPMLPRSTEFAIDLPVRNPDFRDAYEHYLDACVKLEKYEARFSELKKESGKSPLDWEKELDIREIAVVKWNNRAVSLVKAGRGNHTQEAAPNPWRGFVPALYGSAFAIPDDSSYACSEGWYIFGGEDDLEAFLLCEHGTEGSWPSKHTSLVVYRPGMMLDWDKEGIFLNIK